MKINQLTFMKHFEKTSPCPDKIYTFICAFRKLFKYSGRVLLASECRWRTQGAEM